MASQELDLDTTVVPALTQLTTVDRFVLTAGEVPKFKLPPVPAGKTWTLKVSITIKET